MWFDYAAFSFISWTAVIRSHIQSKNCLLYTSIRLKPGESIFVYQGLYHDFSVEPGTGPVLLGEVSQCNDDNTDNRFNPPVGRFPKIEEDEPPYRLLCNEYPAAKD